MFKWLKAQEINLFKQLQSQQTLKKKKTFKSLKRILEQIILINKKLQNKIRLLKKKNKNIKQ